MFFRSCYIYVTSASGRGLSGRVRGDAYIHQSIMLPGSCSGPALCMIHEKTVILKAPLHTRLAG